jgi:hypothetical protein
MFARLPAAFAFALVLPAAVALAQSQPATTPDTPAPAATVPDTSKPADTAKPAVDATTPAADTAKPAADATKPAADATKPAADATKPAADATKPSPMTTTTATPDTTTVFYVPDNMSSNWMASNYVGHTVYGPNNEKLGKITDLILDSDGQAVAAIIGVGGFLGIGEKDVAVSFKALKTTTKNGAEYLTLSVTKDQLKSATKFTKSTRKVM